MQDLKKTALATWLLFFVLTGYLIGKEGAVATFDECILPHPPLCSILGQEKMSLPQTEACREAVRHFFMTDMARYNSCLKRELEMAAFDTNPTISHPAGSEICIMPLRPNCVDKEQVYQEVEQNDLCRTQVTRYEDSVFAFRACLEREITRSVLGINATIDAFKCGTALKRRCSDDDLRRANK